MLRVIVCLGIGFCTLALDQVAAQELRAAVLPQSRSVQVNQAATAFAVILNTTNNNLANCGIALSSAIPATFSFFQTSPANAVTGARNAKATIPAHGSQNFLIELVPQSAIPSSELSFAFTCSAVPAAPVAVGVNTFLFSASTTPVPDILSIGAVLSNDGITNVPGINVPNALGLMTVAAVNLGADQQVTVEAALSTSTTPASVVICETNVTTGACMAPPTTTSLSTRVARSASGTISAYSVFVSARSAINFDPANVRVIVRFRDQTGTVRGATSAALRTRDLVATDSNGDGVWDDAANHAVGILNAAVPSQSNGYQLLLPLFRNAQNSLMFSDLTDIVNNNAGTATTLVSCLYLKAQTPETAAQMIAILTAALATNPDRFQSSVASADRLAGSIVQSPQVNLSVCP